MNDDLYLRVEVMAGADCRSAIHQMCSLASHLRVAVTAKMNGVDVHAVPFCDSKALGDAWWEEMQKPARNMKLVVGRPFELGRHVTDSAGGTTSPPGKQS